MATGYYVPLPNGAKKMILVSEDTDKTLTVEG